MAPKIEKPITGEVAFPVYYEDTDFSGYVYHANYLKYFERAREHAIGMKNLRDLFANGFQYVVRHADVRYRAPTGHGDTIIIKTEATITDSPRIIFHQQALSKNNATVLVEGKLEVVCIKAESGKPAHMPAAMVALFGG